MDDKVIEITADSLDEARKQVNSQVPQGLALLSEEVLADGEPRVARGIAENPSDALEEAKMKVPPGAVIVEKEQVMAAGEKTISVEAFDEDSARAKAKSSLSDGQSVREIILVNKGRRGFFGIGRTANRYELCIHQQVIVQIRFTQQARIRATIGIGPEKMPKPTHIYIFGNGFTPSETEMYQGLAGLLGVQPTLEKELLVGIPIERTTSVCRYDRLQLLQFTDVAIDLAFSNNKHPEAYYFDTILIVPGGRDLFVLAVWEGSAAKVASRLLPGGSKR